VIVGGRALDLPVKIDRGGVWGSSSVVDRFSDLVGFSGIDFSRYRGD